MWGQNIWICVFPILLILASACEWVDIDYLTDLTYGCAGSGFAQTIIFANAKTTHTAFAAALEHWNGSVFSLSLATNVIVTSLIATRVWFAHKHF